MKTEIRLRCINCGQEFIHELKSKSDKDLDKDIKWCRRNIKYCPKCQMSRMGHGYGR